MDSTVEINKANDGIIISLWEEGVPGESLSKVTSQNRHHAVDFGRPAGKELDGSDSRSRRCHPLSFDPASGHEQAGFRPAVVLSPELAQGLRPLPVCPITTSIKGYPFEVTLRAKNLRVVLADQVRSIDWHSRK